MVMVNIWEHLASTVFLAAGACIVIVRQNRRIRDLKQALVAKSSLAGEEQVAIPTGAQVSTHMVPGDTFDVRFVVPVGSIRITASNASQIFVVAFS